MLLQRTQGLLLAAAALVSGFEDATPFFLYSSEPFGSNILVSQEIATAATVEDRLVASLATSDDTTYALISQPGLRTADFKTPEPMPLFRRWIDERRNNGTFVEIPNVMAMLDMRRLSQKISEKTGLPEASFNGQRGSRERERSVMNIQLDTCSMGTMESEHALTCVDHFLASLLPTLPQPYVIVYTSGPGDMRAPSSPEEDRTFHQYEMDSPFPQGLQTALKRDVEMHKRESSPHSPNQEADLPLFETYQFVSPGIFMGLSVSLLLFLILYVGVRAIAGLEVSYMAFNKEMGPQAQNKGKQQ